MGKVILYIAMSLDGYIADEKRKVAFLDEVPPTDQARLAYEEFYKEIGTIVMGNNTYQQIVTELCPDQWPYPNMKSYVCSTTKNEKNENVEFTTKSPKELIELIRSECHMDIWLVGGSKVVHSFQEVDLIDEYIITVAPVILGNGIPLFQKGIEKTKLELIEAKGLGQFVELKYQKR